MPRVIITTDPSTLPHEISVLLDERVRSVHLSTDHAASQLVERIAWAISDAEDAEDAERTAGGRGLTSASPAARRGRARRHPPRPQRAAVAGR